MQAYEGFKPLDLPTAGGPERSAHPLLTPRADQLAELPAGLPPLLTVLVDAEEDFDWSKPFSHGEASVASMRHQHRAQAIFRKYGVVPTYVVDYPVASQPDGYGPLREFFASGECEIGAQLHPWVNPPLGEPVNVFNSFPGNLPPQLEAAKLASLTAMIEASFGVRPVVYKAGRYGVGPNTSAIIEQAGYRVDTSVVANRSFAPEQGADFTAIGPHPYWFGDRGDLLELPLTCDFTGALRGVGRRLYTQLSSPLGRALHLPGMLARLRLLDRIPLTPEGVTLAEAKRLTDTLLAAGVRVFVVAYHSPSLEPGNTPYVRDQAELRRFLDWIEGYFEHFFGRIGGRPTTPRDLFGLLHRRDVQSPD